MVVGVNVDAYEGAARIPKLHDGGLVDNKRVKHIHTGVHTYHFLCQNVHKASHAAGAKPIARLKDLGFWLCPYQHGAFQVTCMEIHSG